MAISKNLYLGTTLDTTLDVGFGRSNAALIKKDLLNHLFTRKGERVDMPNFGTNLKDLLFEPLDELLKTRIAGEIQAVIDYDPRVELLSITVAADEDRHTLTVELIVRFIEIQVIDNINLDLQLAA